MPAPLAHGDGILTTAQQRLEAALDRLETADRALLELSLRQGVEDLALADLLAVDPDDLGRRRWRALERLAEELGVQPNAQLEADLAQLWAAERVEPESQRQPEPEALPFGAPITPAARRPRRGPRAAALALGGAALAIAVGIVIGALAGDDDGDEPSRPANAPRKAASGRTGAAPGPPRPLALAAVGAARGSGSVRLESRQRLRLTVRGLPPGQYTAWLFSSIVDALPLTRFGGGDHTELLQLPEEAPRFRYVDISREPPDGNPNHSGQSVVRAPLDRLLGPS